MILHKLIGLEWEKEVGLWDLGIRTIKVLFTSGSKPPDVKKLVTALVKDSPTMF